MHRLAHARGSVTLVKSTRLLPFWGARSYGRGSVTLVKSTRLLPSRDRKGVVPPEIPKTVKHPTRAGDSMVDYNSRVSRYSLAWLQVSLFAALTPCYLKGGGLSGEEFQTANCQPGRYGGRLAVSLRAEPNTLNPLIALDAPSREAIGRMNGDLITINRATQRTGPGLAKSWTLSKDGRRFELRLRRGIRFSDGHPFDADDVMFTFAVYLDEKIHSPQRDLLVVAGKPVAVRKIDPYTVEFQLAGPYSAAERMFDSVAILPRHLLEASYRDGTLARAWTLNTPPEKIAGLGPFRLKEYRPGERLTLERNPYYWKVDTAGNRLPYLNELVFLFAGSEDAQVLRFSAGETDIVDRLSAANFAMLARDAAAKGLRVEDLGPGLEYSFLFFNLKPAAGEKYPGDRTEAALVLLRRLPPSGVVGDRPRRDRPAGLSREGEGDLGQRQSGK